MSNIVEQINETEGSVGDALALAQTDAEKEGWSSVLIVACRSDGCMEFVRSKVSTVEELALATYAREKADQMIADAVAAEETTDDA